MGGERAVEIAATSTEYVRVTAVAKIAGSVIAVASPPRFAFLPTSSTTNPAAEDWIDGEWAAPHARILIGPSGGHELPAGTYTVWLGFTAGLEHPVVRTGTLTVY